MIHFGFSYIGLLYLIMLIVPNLIWTKHKPKGYEEYVVHENKVLLILERIGEVLVSCIALIFADFNLRRFTAWSLWLVISFVCMILYEIYWIRYFKSEQTMQDFYKGLLFVPVAGATYPVFAFFLLGIYGSNLPMIISTVILGIGHIGIHLMHAKEVYGERKRKPVLLKIGTGQGSVLAGGMRSQCAICTAGGIWGDREGDCEVVRG